MSVNPAVERLLATAFSGSPHRRLAIRSIDKDELYQGGHAKPEASNAKSVRRPGSLENLSLQDQSSRSMLKRGGRKK